MTGTKKPSEEISQQSEAEVIGAGEEKQGKRPARKPRKHTPNERRSKRPKAASRVSARSILQKAYRKVDEKLSKSGSSKPIDDLVKLMKLERELGPEKQATKEIKVRWEENEEKPSNDA